MSGKESASMDEMPYEASILLCSRNRADILEKTLQSLRGVKVPPRWSVELLLADNASTDRTPEVVSAFEHPDMLVRGLSEPSPGKSKALNRAISASSGKVLLFTDDDVRFPQHWIERMSAPILQDTADAVQGGVELAESVNPDWMTPRHRGVLASTERIDADQPSRLVGANMAIARKVFNEITMLDPELGVGGKYGAGEDTLLSWQLREAGLRIESAFDVSVEHHVVPSRLSFEAFEEMAEKQGRASAYMSYHWKHRRYPLPALYAGWAYYTARLWWQRAVNGICGDVGEEMPMNEFLLRRKIYRICQHLCEHGTPRRYDQRGLTKKNMQPVSEKGLASESWNAR
jgi:glycosyltransferase involved in cell wall biosynthesis